jgi:RHS repeat-associated protein
MPKIWCQPTTLIAHTITGKPHKLSAKFLILLCMTVAVNNSAHAQGPLDPWANAAVTYGTITLQGTGNSSDGLFTQIINQTMTAHVRLTGAAGNFVWSTDVDEKTALVSLNDAVSWECQTAQQSATVTDTWVAAGIGSVRAALDINPATNSYVFTFYSYVNGTRTEFVPDATSCAGSTSDNLFINVSTYPQFTSQDLPMPSSAPVLTGSLAFSGTPADVGQTLNDVIPPQALNWTLTWNFSPVPDDTVENPCNSMGSTIGCQNQSLGEDIPISGTPFSLHYQSDRQLGHAAVDTLAMNDAQSLSGWTLSVHHVLEQQLINLFCIDGSCTPASFEPKALYLGDGRMRSAAKVQAPVIVNSQIYVTSEDGGEIYVFDKSSNRHVKTLRPLAGAVVYSFGYDNAGQLISVTDAYNNVTMIIRDSNEHPTGIVSPYRQTTSLKVDGNGYLSQITDPAGNKVQLVHSTTGLLTSMTDANGNPYSYRYDSLGRLQKDSDPAGGSTTLTRTDIATGYQVAKVTALGKTSTFQTTFSSTAGISSSQSFTNTWPCCVPQATRSEIQATNKLWENESLSDGSSYNTTLGPDPRWGIQMPIANSTTITVGDLSMNITSARSAVLAIPGKPFTLTSQTETKTVNGRTSTSTYTASDGSFTNVTPAGRILTTQLDANERIASTQLGDLLATNFGYDGRGRLATITQGTRSETLSYDSNGYLASIVDPLLQQTSFINDATGHRLKTTLADGLIIKYGFDANGNLTSVTPPGKSRHDFSFNGVNLPLSYTPPLVPGTGPTNYTYDADRRISLITRPDNGTVKYNYDDAGRVSSLATPAATLNYGYSPTTGNLISAGISGGEQLMYNDGPLLTITSWSGMVEGSVSHALDNDFRITSRSINGGDPIAFSYDDDGLLTQAGPLTITRSKVNGLITETAMGVVKESRAYDQYGDLKGYIATIYGAPIAGNNPIVRPSPSTYKVGFKRDGAGRIIGKLEVFRPGGPPRPGPTPGEAQPLSYNYDASGQVTSVTQYSAAQDTDVTLESYSYDSNFNRLTATTPLGSQSATYDAQDRLLTYGSASYTYTANGELLSKTVATQTTTYVYDVLGNLTATTLSDGTKISYILDAENRRVGKKVNGVLVAGFLYDGNKIVAQLDANNQVVSQFVYATGTDSPDYMVKAGVSYRIFADQLGSPALVVNTSTGEIVEQIAYDSFGNVIQDTRPGFQPFGFAGGLYDRDTKLLRFGTRDYDTSVGRWTAKDPILFSGVCTNLYAYVLNDPVNLTDPTGLQEQVCSCKPALLEVPTQSGSEGGGVGDCWQKCMKNAALIFLGPATVNSLKGGPGAGQFNAALVLAAMPGCLLGCLSHNGPIYPPCPVNFKDYSHQGLGYWGP